MDSVHQWSVWASIPTWYSWRWRNSWLKL